MRTYPDPKCSIYNIPLLNVKRELKRRACGALVSRIEFSLRIFATPLGEDYYTDDLLLEIVKLGYSA